MNGRRAGPPQARVEGERVAAPGGAEALGEIDLEDVAGADVVDRAAHGLLVARARQRAAPFARPASCRGVRASPTRAAHAGGARRRRHRGAARPCRARGPTRARPRSGRAQAAAARGRRPPATGSVSISRPRSWESQPAHQPSPEAVERAASPRWRPPPGAPRGTSGARARPNPGMLSSSTRPGSCRRASAAAKGSAQGRDIQRMVSHRL